MDISLPPSNELVIMLVAVVIFSSVIISLLCRGVSGPKGKIKRVLLSGPCGAGKTRLLHKLCTGQDVHTVTSMTASSLNWVDGKDKGVNKMNQTVDFVDVPGYYRLLGQLRKELSTVSAVVFLLDGSALASSSRAAAEILYEILTHPSLKKCSGLLICCNKSDLATGRETRAMAALTREVQRIRISREAMVNHTLLQMNHYISHCHIPIIVYEVNNNHFI
eukprot:285780_1